ncbi:MAG: helix-turn-helix domain-containing protein [Acidobacteriota bacterium]
MAKTSDAVRILRGVTGDDAQLQGAVAQARVNVRVAQMIYDARTKAGLSQRELAALIGTRQPVIARLEDADYGGHSLRMLQRIAEALNQRLELRFVAEERPERRPTERPAAWSARRQQSARRPAGPAATRMLH